MEDIKAKAVQAHSEGRLLEAERSYRILLEKSDDSDVAVNLGALLRSQGRYQECSTHYHRCLQQWPLHRNLILNAHNCWRETGETAASLHWLEHGHKQHPDDIQLLEALAEALAQAGKTAESIRQYESILKTNSERTQSWMGLGLVHGRVGHLTDSAACYKKVLSINKNEPQAKANLLTIYKQKGDFEQAHKLINSLGKEEQQQPDVLKAIADLLICEGDNTAASHHLAALATKHPNRAHTGLIGLQV